MHTAPLVGLVESGRQHDPRTGWTHGNGTHDAAFALNTP
jgi:hypothetical protein